MSGERMTLVLGGTGKTGRRVARGLAARGVRVRIGSRSSAPPFEWSDERTWGDALAGAGAAYVAYAPDLAVAGAAQAVGAFARLAAGRGVRRLVLLSGRGEPGALAAEREVRASGAAWTILRCSFFSQNFSEGLFAAPLRSGALALPAGDVREPFVDAEDVAAVAVAALTEEGHAGAVYELTGPRLLRFADAVAEIGRAAGRELRYVPVSLDAYAAALSEQDVPADVVSLVRYLFGEVLDGRNASVAYGVQRALGRSPRDFAAYAQAAAAAGAWDP